MPGLNLGEQYRDRAQRDAALTFGMWVFLASEVLLFAGLFTLYASYRAMYGADFADGVRHNTLAYGTVNMYLLLLSSFTVALAIWAVRRGHLRVVVAMLLLTMTLGIGFLVVKGVEYAAHVQAGALPGPYFRMHQLPTFGANRFFTMYWVMTGTHALHVTGGVGILGWLTWRAAHRSYSPSRHVGLEMGALYWHLIDIVWIFLWPLLYLT